MNARHSGKMPYCRIVRKKRRVTSARERKIWLKLVKLVEAGLAVVPKLPPLCCCYCHHRYCDLFQPPVAEHCQIPRYRGIDMIWR